MNNSQFVTRGLATLDKIEDWSLFSLVPVLLAHTAVHYLAARLLGLDVKWRSYAHLTIHVRRADWRLIITLLAPSVMGVVSWLRLLAWIAPRHDPIGYVLVTFAALGLQSACVSDLWVLGYYCRYRYWPLGHTPVFVDSTDTQHAFVIPSELLIIGTKSTVPARPLLRSPSSGGSSDQRYEAILTRLAHTPATVEPENLVYILFLPIALLHETCHYLTARLLGIRVLLRWHYVRIRTLDKGWRRCLVILAPSLIGWIGWMVLSWLVWSIGYPLLLIPLSLFGLAWQVSCGGDLSETWYRLRFGRWREHYVFPPRPRANWRIRPK